MFALLWTFPLKIQSRELSREKNALTKMSSCSAFALCPELLRYPNTFFRNPRSTLAQLYLLREYFVIEFVKTGELDWLCCNERTHCLSYACMTPPSNVTSTEQSTVESRAKQEQSNLKTRAWFQNLWCNLERSYAFVFWVSFGRFLDRSDQSALLQAGTTTLVAKNKCWRGELRRKGGGGDNCYSSVFWSQWCV